MTQVPPFRQENSGRKQPVGALDVVVVVDVVEVGTSSLAIRLMHTLPSQTSIGTSVLTGRGIGRLTVPINKGLGRFLHTISFHVKKIQLLGLSGEKVSTSLHSSVNVNPVESISPDFVYVPRMLAHIPNSPSLVTITSSVPVTSHRSSLESSQSLAPLHTADSATQLPDAHVNCEDEHAVEGALTQKFHSQEELVTHL
jgi:hypothetical protein